MKFIHVATLDELRERNCIVVKGADRPLAVFYNDGDVKAVDNRCPHMGFPLHQGTVSDGILTCHWHHARFDLAGGCTFDLFADDVPTSPVEIRDGDVWVADRPFRADEEEYRQRRLLQGMEQNINLITAKSVIALLDRNVDYREIVRTGARFGAQWRDGWQSGMTIMTAMANLIPFLPHEEQVLALYQGLTHVADDCDGAVPRRDRYPLEGTTVSPSVLKRWFRYWTLVRHRDAAERTILTAIQNGLPVEGVAEIMLSAVTDRYYADTGHALDFINKAFELLDLVGYEEASTILPTVVRGLVSARGGEELNAWRHPVDLVPLLQDAFDRLEEWCSEGKGRSWDGETDLTDTLLADDPTTIVAALGNAIREGARPEQLARTLAYAAALRIARFGTANEFGDWITALHTFTYCNALHSSLQRLESAGIEHTDVVRGVFHGAMSVYLDRFLNVPPAPLPGERESLESEPDDPDELLALLTSLLNRQQQVEPIGRITARYLDLGHPVQPLIVTLTHGVVREDADFHTFQMLEAGVRQYHQWGTGPEGRNIMVATARFMAAHSPTQRSAYQTAEIALRLHRSEAIYE